MPSALHDLSAAEAARRIASCELTSVALVESCLERIAAREREVQAWEFIDTEMALTQARALDRETERGTPRGPLHGVPFGIKDVIDTADMPTQYNSPIYRGYRPRWDAACVAQLREAGCVILGKTVTTEFANNHPSRTRNPRNPAHTPGGSSSGSAAAVADCMVPLALGTQTGGSTIRPAAYCGAVGCKPSFGSINRAGLKFVAESLDTIGVFARAAADAALAIHVLSGRPLSGGTGRRAPHIGLCRTCWKEADEATRGAIEHAAAAAAKAGARVTDFEMPAGSERLYDEHGIVMHYEAARALGWEYRHHADQISPSLRPRLEEGRQFSREAYDAARELARDCRLRFADAMRDVDFLLTPGAPGEAPEGYATTGSSLFNRVWTLLGVPCVTLPHGTGPRGLPLGVQLIGRYDADMDLLAWAEWMEQQLSRT